MAFFVVLFNQPNHKTNKFWRKPLRFLLTKVTGQMVTCFCAVLFSGWLRHLRFLPIVYSCWHVQITVGNVSGMFVIFIKLYGSPDECFFLIDKTKCKHNKYFCLICESKCSWKGYPLELKKINKQQNFSNYYMSCV